MGRLFILIKRKGAKSFQGAIPAKRGATRSQLKKLLARKKKGFSGKIVTEAELRRVLIKSLPKKTKMQILKRKAIKRRTRTTSRRRKR